MTTCRIILAALALLLYLTLPTKNYYWDGVLFAQLIEDARDYSQLFHPNHLVYNVVGWAFYHLLQRSVRALYVLQSLNAVFAAATVYVISGIIADLGRSRSETILLSCFFALSGTWWRFSTDANAYIPSVLCLCLCARLLLRADSAARPTTVALVHTAAMLLHQLAFLFFPATLYVLWKKVSPDRTQRRRVLVRYLGVTGICTFAAYALAFSMQVASRSPGGFAAWTTSYAENASFSFHAISNTLISVRSWLQVFVVGRPSLVRYSEPATMVLLTLCVMVLAGLIFQLLRRKKAAPSSAVSTIAGDRRTLLQFAALWFISYCVFLFFWLPHNTFYKLFGLPPIIIGIAVLWSSHPTLRFRDTPVLFVLLLGLTNLTFGMIPYSRDTANGAIQFALRLRTPLADKAIVYFSAFNSDDWFARYFNPQTAWKHADSTDMIDADLGRGTDVWLETTAIDEFSRTAPKWLGDRVQGAEWHELVNAKHRIRFVRLSRRKSSSRMPMPAPSKILGDSAPVPTVRLGSYA